MESRSFLLFYFTSDVSVSRRKMIRCDHQNEYTFLIHSAVDFVCDKRVGLKHSQNTIESAALRPLVNDSYHHSEEKVMTSETDNTGGDGL